MENGWKNTKQFQEYLKTTPLQYEHNQSYGSTKGGMNTQRNQFVMRTGILLILATGLIHVIEAPDSFGDATSKGVLFVLNGIGALVAATGIFRQDKRWGWGLGLLVAGSAFVAYALSRSVGLPQIPAEPDAWFEPIGISSFLIEGIYSLLAMWVLSRPGLLSGVSERR